MIRYIALMVLLVVIFSSCHKNGLSNIPNISSLSLHPNTIKAGSSEDTVFIFFHLQDGDADLGNDPNGTNYDIYLTDSRDGSVQGMFFPSIDTRIEDPNRGIEGTCTIKLLAANLLPRPDHPNGDTLHYDVYIKDRAQHSSNHLTTPDIYIKP